MLPKLFYEFRINQRMLPKMFHESRITLRPRLDEDTVTRNLQTNMPNGC